MKCKPHTIKFDCKFLRYGARIATRNSPKNFQMMQNIWNERRTQKGGINSRLFLFQKFD